MPAPAPTPPYALGVTAPLGKTPPLLLRANEERLLRKPSMAALALLVCLSKSVLKRAVLRALTCLTVWCDDGLAR